MTTVPPRDLILDVLCGHGIDEMPADRMATEIIHALDLDEPGVRTESAGSVEGHAPMLAHGGDCLQAPAASPAGIKPGPADDIQSATEDLQLAGYAIVHTDGGCEPNPGTGGWGVVIDAAPGRKIELCGGERSTTNNRMEMTAAIVALTVLPTTCAVTIVSDSQYLINGMTKWVAGWRRNGFKKKKAPIPNADLWRTLDTLSQGRVVGWRWVRGHNGHAANERADRLASEGRRKALRAAA